MSRFTAAAALLLLLTLAQAVDGRDPAAASLIQNLDESMINSVPGEGLWLIIEHAPGTKDSERMAPEWEEAAMALRGIIKVGAIDAIADPKLASWFDNGQLPMVKMMVLGKYKQRQMYDFTNGGKIPEWVKAQDIVRWALEQAKHIALERIGIEYEDVKPYKRPKVKSPPPPPPPPPSSGLYGSSSDVIALTDASFHSQVTGEDLWMVEFYAPWCGHCQSLKPDWEQLATEVKGRVKVGAVDCTTEKATCQEFGIKGFPTIKVFGADKESPSEYRGGRDGGSLAAFALAEWRKLQPPPEAKELVDQHVLEADCSGSEGRPPAKLCLIAFLPDILDSKAAGRRAYIQVLNGLAAKYADRPFSYLWLPGGAQPELEAALGVGGYGYPALVALNPKEGKFAALRESFDAPHAMEFLERVRRGKERVAAVTGGLPELRSGAPWDGGEGAAVEADEFSLDDLMREEL